MHANLIANLKNSWPASRTRNRKQLLAAETEINARREARREYYRRLQEESRHAASEEKERLLVDREKTYDGGRRLEDAYQDCPGAVGNLGGMEAVKGRLGNYRREPEGLGY